MGRVDDSVDSLGPEKCRKALGAAEAANPLRDRRRRRVGGRACERQQGLDAGLAGEAARERARFRRSAENEETKALQGMAP